VQLRETAGRLRPLLPQAVRTAVRNGILRRVGRQGRPGGIRRLLCGGHPGHRRLCHSAQGLFPGAQGRARRLSHPARGRRNPDGFLPYREILGHGTFRGHARRGGLRQGHDQRPQSAVGHLGQGGPHQSGGLSSRLHPFHLFQQPARNGRGPGSGAHAGGGKIRLRDHGGREGRLFPRRTAPAQKALSGHRRRGRPGFGPSRRDLPTRRLHSGQGADGPDGGGGHALHPVRRRQALRPPPGRGRRVRARTPTRARPQEATAPVAGLLARLRVRAEAQASFAEARDSAQSTEARERLKTDANAGDALAGFYAAWLGEAFDLPPPPHAWAWQLARCFHAGDAAAWREASERFPEYFDLNQYLHWLANPETDEGHLADSLAKHFAKQGEMGKTTPAKHFALTSWLQLKNKANSDQGESRGDIALALLQAEAEPISFA